MCLFCIELYVYRVIVVVIAIIILIVVVDVDAYVDIVVSLYEFEDDMYVCMHVIENFMYVLH